MRKYRKGIIITAVLFVLILIGVLIMPNQDSNKLFSAVQGHVQTHGNAATTLSDLTDFDWDQALYFRFPASSNEIYEAIGVEFVPPDLSIGIIFSMEEELVYYELFPRNINESGEERASQFMLILDGRLEMGVNVRVFGREDVFEVMKTDSGNYRIIERN
ncbi:MAG: hypothetical protein FWC72_06045 [Oscillospiraceae bacterium]|nr:hypothetical protein [Oscillospiraceae bacterium]